MTGQVSFFRCTAGCDAIDTGGATFRAAPKQLVLPAIGIRYLQYFFYRAEHGDARESSATEVFAQVVFKDIDAQEYPLYDINEKRRDVADLGFRVGARTPPGLFYRCLIPRKYCAASTFSVGYAPTAFPIFLEGSIEIPIDVY
jgi:hypothetical protein